jgi:23S rRNA (pseudouridine1915-N3)-methyltransferase
VKWRIVTVGKPALAYAKAGVDDYARRLSRSIGLELVHLKDGRHGVGTSRAAASSSPGLRVVLDERGELLTTELFADKVSGWELQGVKAVTFFIGGADGHSQEMRDGADLVFALSPLTLQHELALLVLLEQIYRVYSIKRGTPYHR